jgi:hypothetical protein
MRYLCEVIALCLIAAAAIGFVFMIMTAMGA